MLNLLQIFTYLKSLINHRTLYFDYIMKFWNEKNLHIYTLLLTKNFSAKLEKTV